MAFEHRTKNRHLHNLNKCNRYTWCNLVAIIRHDCHVFTIQKSHLGNIITMFCMFKTAFLFMCNDNWWIAGANFIKPVSKSSLLIEFLFHTAAYHRQSKRHASLPSVLVSWARFLRVVTDKLRAQDQKRYQV